MASVKPLVAAGRVRTQPSTLIPSANYFAQIPVAFQSLSTGAMTTAQALQSIDAAGAKK